MRDCKVAVIVSEEEKRQLRVVAAMEGLTVSGYLRELALEQIEKHKRRGRKVKATEPVKQDEAQEQYKPEAKVEG